MRWTSKNLLGCVALGSLAWTASAVDILTSSGFANCQNDASMRVNNADITFDRSTGVVKFNVSGTSEKEQEVEAKLVVTVYGIQVYTRDFDPCSDATKVEQLCPVPEGTFSAEGEQEIPEDVLSKIPGIAFTIPDLDGNAELKLTAKESGDEVGCINTSVSNGRTLEAPAVGYFAAGVAGAALVLSGLSAAISGGGVGSNPSSLGFMTIMGWFQTCATTGMYSVKYPPLYRSFAQNFAFSTGLIPLDAMQTSIDNFRKSTGGNLTENSVEYLRKANLTFNDGQGSTPTPSKFRRGLANLLIRQDLNLGASSDTNVKPEDQNGFEKTVSGITAYAEKLKIPASNTFMTVLLIFLIIVGAIIVGILLFKVILETWALFGTFPKKLTGFRKRYWRLLGNTLTNLILLLYGIWTTWCVYQFTNGDSWAAKTLAGVTWAMFTGILVFYSWKVSSVANKYKKAEGDVSGLYENKDTWIKYSLFYDVYKQRFWWMFMPLIVFMFARGAALAAATNHGLIQTIIQLVIEIICLLLFVFTMPFATKGGNWIHVVIQVVRVLSVGCILIFVERLGITQTTQTITGIVLIAVQATLSVVLAILILVNAIIVCCKENPHRKRRKEQEKLNRDFDNLTPLDARNSLLLGPMEQKGVQGQEGYQMGPYKSRGSYTPVMNQHAQESSDNLVGTAAPFGHAQPHSRSRSNSRGDDLDGFFQRQPTLPNLGAPPGYAPQLAPQQGRQVL